jgi:uncharacterized membrane protein YfhO
VLHPPHGKNEQESGSPWNQDPVIRLNHENSGLIHLTAEYEKDGWLVANEIFYPGWRVWIDGDEVPLMRANGLMRAVRMPAGKHEAVFKFVPESVYQGVLLSAAGLFIFVFLLSRRRVFGDR